MTDKPIFWSIKTVYQKLGEFWKVLNNIVQSKVL